MTSSATQKSRTNRRKATVDESDSTAAKTPKSQRSPIKKSANAKTAKSKAEVTKLDPGILSGSSAELDARTLQVTLKQAFDQTKAAGEKQSTRTQKTKSNSAGKSPSVKPRARKSAGAKSTSKKSSPGNSSGKKIESRESNARNTKPKPDQFPADTPTSAKKPAVPFTATVLPSGDALELLVLLQEKFPNAVEFCPSPNSLQIPTLQQFETDLKNDQDDDSDRESVLNITPDIKPGKTRPWLSKLTKSAIGLLLIVAAGWLPAQRLFQVSSVQAVVNAKLITLRAPISGIVSTEFPDATVGRSIPQQKIIFKIRNTRTDRAQLDRLQREYFTAQNESAALSNRLKFMDHQRQKIETQINKFTGGRIKQLEGELNAIEAEIAAAVALRDQSQLSLSRSSFLNAKGFVTDAHTEQARTKSNVAEQQIKVLNARQKIVAVELEAAKQGNFVGDSYNDLPSSSQLLVQLNTKINRLEIDRQKWMARQRQISDTLVEARSQFDRLSEASVKAPIQGKVWEVMTSPGEHVSKGQDLIRLLDCNTGIVTSTVSESVYNQLRIGTPAQFRFREGGKELSGYVVQLTGLATARSNLAIRPSSLIKESYRVMIAIPELGSGSACHVGQTGRVIFNNPDSF